MSPFGSIFILWTAILSLIIRFNKSQYITTDESAYLYSYQDYVPYSPRPEYITINQLKDVTATGILNSANPNQFLLDATDDIGYHLQVILDNPMVFHPTQITRLQIEIGSDSPIGVDSRDLLVTFSQNSSQYFTTFVSIDEDSDNEIYPKCNQTVATPLATGDIASIVSQNISNCDRYCKACQGTGDFIPPYIPNIQYPLTFIIENYPTENYMKFTCTNLGDTSRFCLYSAMIPNAPLDIYIAAEDVGEDFDITYIDLLHTTFATYSPTMDPTIDPTMDPTTEPTQNPTQNPSDGPSMSPTNEPTSNPTLQPSFEPTIEPTDVSSNPTQSPTTKPTFQPSMIPTSDPSTSVPTTFAPTFEPTQEPIVNGNPFFSSTKSDDIGAEVSSTQGNNAALFGYQLILKIVGGILFISVILSIFDYLHSKCHCGTCCCCGGLSDQYHWPSIILIGMRYSDEILDISVLYWMSIYYLYTDQTDTNNLIIIILILVSVVSLLLTYLINLFSMYKIVKMQVKSSGPSIWFNKHMLFFVFMVLFTSDSYLTLNLISSNIFGMKLFNSGHTSIDLHRMRSTKTSTIVLQV